MLKARTANEILASLGVDLRVTPGAPMDLGAVLLPIVDRLLEIEAKLEKHDVSEIVAVGDRVGVKSVRPGYEGEVAKMAWQVNTLVAQMAAQEAARQDRKLFPRLWRIIRP